MNNILIEPTDVLFFRDAIPMSAGQGKGNGCRLPFPTTLHEAFRASLLRARGDAGLKKKIPGRPKAAARNGNWHAQSHETDLMIASKAFRSLQTIGPFPWHKDNGLLLPVPLDVAFTRDNKSLARLALFRVPVEQWSAGSVSNFHPPCLPLATTPPQKSSQSSGWWTVPQFKRYLDGEADNSAGQFKPIATDALWQPEHRVGIQIDPCNFSAAGGQLFAGSYLRPDKSVYFAAAVHLADPQNDEQKELDSLSWLLFGGEFRLARLRHKTGNGGHLQDFFAQLRQPPQPPAGDGPCLLKWVLVTPALFSNGSLPGWCASTKKDLAGSQPPIGHVCLDLPGRAFLVSWCLGRPLPVSGWDVPENRAKPTLLAVPQGSVYYFLCENRPTAAALADKLNWKPRSDFYGEKGCGYGLVSFDVKMHQTSADVFSIANQLFNCQT